MGKVIWSPSALHDVDAIAEYIAHDSVDQAAFLVVRLFEVTDRLQLFPKYGRIIPEINDDLCREIFCGDYRIMYRLQDADVWITGIIHGARNWSPKNH